jgi:hypothetical protein
VKSEKTFGDSGRTVRATATHDVARNNCKMTMLHVKWNERSASNEDDCDTMM